MTDFVPEPQPVTEEDLTATQPVPQQNEEVEKEKY